jgi:hypothetical protein
METTKGGFKHFLDSFHQTSWNFIGISTSVWQLLRGWTKFKMAAVAMVTKVQKMLNSLRTADPFETWHKNRSSLKVVLFVIKIFKMAANIKIKKIVKYSKMKRFQWKWIFTGSKTCCTIWWPFRFAMAATLNPKWPPKYKKSSDLGEIWFPSRLWCCELISKFHRNVKHYE